jgi:hypothetical protein
MWNLGPLHLEIADHGFHLVLGTILAVTGLLADHDSSEGFARRPRSTMASGRT